QAPQGRRRGRGAQDEEGQEGQGAPQGRRRRRGRGLLSPTSHGEAGSRWEPAFAVPALPAHGSLRENGGALPMRDEWDVLAGLPVDEPDPSVPTAASAPPPAASTASRVEDGASDSGTPGMTHSGQR